MPANERKCSCVIVALQLLYSESEVIEHNWRYVNEFECDVASGDLFAFMFVQASCSVFLTACQCVVLGNDQCNVAVQI